MRRISDTIARMAAFGQSFSGVSGVDDRLVALDAFGSNPGALGAKVYLPPALPPGAPLVVALHGCTQTATGYDDGTGWSTLADRAGFAVLFPEQRRSNNANLCFNWFEPGDIGRIGSEAQSIAQMVEAVVTAHKLDRTRIFVTGLSAGGAMAAVMLATYPDIFAAGAIIGGLPYGCATNVAQALDRMRGHGAVDDAASAARVRTAASGIDRETPAVSIWHGTTDATVAPSNMDRLAGQWRGVHGLSAAPTETDIGANWDHRVWRDGSGRAAVEMWRVSGMGHGVPIDPSGPGGLGRAGPYMLDVGLSSTRAIAASWDLLRNEREVSVEDHTSDASPRRPEATAVGGVEEIIGQALRSAGLLR